MTRCSWPVETEDAVKPCNRRAILVFRLGRFDYPRCKAHSGKAALAKADEVGATIVQL